MDEIYPICDHRVAIVGIFKILIFSKTIWPWNFSLLAENPKQFRISRFECLLAFAALTVSIICLLCPIRDYYLCSACWKTESSFSPQSRGQMVWSFRRVNLIVYYLQEVPNGPISHFCGVLTWTNHYPICDHSVPLVDKQHDHLLTTTSIGRL